MANLKEILFQQYASDARQRVLQEFQDKYEPKRGGRFNSGGVTYEVSPLKAENNALQVEVSSKIPKDQIQDKMTREEFFEGVKKSAVAKGYTPTYVGMDDIIHKVGDREIKKRDYIRIKYNFEYNKLYDDKAIITEVQAIQDGKSDLVVPEIPGVQSLCGRLTLVRLNESMYVNIKECLQALVQANEGALKKIK